MDVRITVLAGGVGAARFLEGLVRAVEDPREVTAVCNVGDDFEWHGLHVSPDIDSVIYTLAGLEGDLGWGLRGDTFEALGALAALGEEPWFRIGDRDLATHLLRTEVLRGGGSLSDATARIARERSVVCAVVPVTDDPHPTRVLTADGELEFQQYFVARRAQDRVSALRFPGAAKARPAPNVIEAIRDADVVLIAPSNPFLSIQPLFEVTGVRKALASAAGVRAAVSPIVGGAAVKGPAAEIMASLRHEVSALGVARIYQGLLDLFVLDEVDAKLAPAIEALGLRTLVTDTMMTSPERRRALAHEVIDAAGALSQSLTA